MTKPIRLLNRNFVLLWQGQFVSMLGDQAFFIAVMFWVKHQTGSATLMGTIMAAAGIPAVILGPLAGSFADNYSRRSIIIWTDILRGLLVLGFTALVFWSPDSTDLIIVGMFIVAVSAASLSAFFRPAISAAIPDIVPTDKLTQANSMNQMSMQCSTLLGQGIGGVAFRLLGAPLLFFIDGVTYLFSAVSEMFIEIPQVKRAASEKPETVIARFKRDTVEGIRFVWHNRGLRDIMMVAAFLNFFIVPIIVLMPFYVEDTLGSTTDWFGFMMAALGGGAMVGYLAAGTLKPSPGTRMWLLLIGLTLNCLAFGALGLLTSSIQAVALMFLIGLLNGYVNIFLSTIMQLTTPTEIRGRVFALLGTVSSGLTPIAMALTGVVADMTGQNIRGIYITCGVCAALMAIILALDQHFRKYLSYDETANKPDPATDTPTTDSP
ncbi:MAG TPA: MFS transporter [candidate division Zixibacteria bacterium]|nr:MFS transporter [candidate division Zixibacteria bacterium]